MRPINPPTYANTPNGAWLPYPNIYTIPRAPDTNLWMQTGMNSQPQYGTNPRYGIVAPVVKYGSFVPLGGTLNRFGIDRWHRTKPLANYPLRPILPKAKDARINPFAPLLAPGYMNSITYTNDQITQMLNKNYAGQISGVPA